MKVNWRVFANVSNEKKAEIVLKKFLKQLDESTNEAQIESYHKGGFLLTIKTISKQENWAEVVLDLLISAGQIGRGWLISGDIQHELDLWSNEPRITGVQSVHLQCDRNQGA